MSFYIDENGNIGVRPEIVDTPDYKWVKYPKKRILKRQMELAEEGYGDMAADPMGNVMPRHRNNMLFGDDDIMGSFYGI